MLGKVTGTDAAGKRILEKSDARIGVLVAKKDDLYLYGTAEDEYSDPGAAPLDLRKQLEGFFASMTVPGQTVSQPAQSAPQPPAGSAPTAGLPEGFVLNEEYKEQFTIAIPRDFAVFDQGKSLRATGMRPGAFDMIRYQPANSIDASSVETLLKVDSGEIPTFFVQKLSADNGMYCTGFSERAVKKLIDLIGKDRDFKGKNALEPAHGEPVSVGGCKGLRVRAKGQPASGPPVATDAYMASDGKTVYVFSLRAHAEYFDKNEEIFQKAVSTVKLSAAK